MVTTTVEVSASLLPQESVTMMMIS